MTITSRKRVWIEVPELDLSDLLIAYDYATSTNIATEESYSDTLIYSDAISTNEYISHEDTLIYSDVISITTIFAPEVLDTLIFSDEISGDPRPFGDIENILFFSDTIGYLQGSNNVDTLIVNDSITGRLSATSGATDTVSISDSITSHNVSSTQDSVIYSDTLASTLHQSSDNTDYVIVSELSVSRASITSATVDSLVFSDSIGYGFVGAVTDSLIASDVISGNVSISSPVLSDTVIVSETLAGPVAIYAAVLTDTLTVSDMLTGAFALVGVLSDTVLFGDTLSDAAYQTLVVVNAETGAVSTYTMTPVVAGLTEYRGTLYLAGPDGLYAMDASEDEDGEVVWTLRTGFSNLGSDLLKRVRDANILGRTEGNTLLKVVTSRGGQKQEYHYQLPETTRDAYRDGVTKVGRGLQSVYWQFALQGTGPAEVDQLKLAIEPLSRRR